MKLLSGLQIEQVKVVRDEEFLLMRKEVCTAAQ